MLEAVRDDACWCTFEGALNQQLLRVSDLQPPRVRLDRPMARGSWGGTDDGWVPWGHRKDHRPALPPVQGMLAAWEPLGLPVATAGGPGQRADAPLSGPAMTRGRASGARRGRWYVGDCQRCALETRAFLQAGGAYYGCPLAALQSPPEGLAAYGGPVWTGQPPWTRLSRTAANGKRPLIAESDGRLAPLGAVVGGAPLLWTARRLVIRSRQLAQAGERGLRARLTQAQAAVAARPERRPGQPRLTQRPALQEAVEALLRRYRGEGWLAVRDEEGGPERPGRRSRNRPARVQMARQAQVNPRVDQEAGAAAVRQRGGGRRPRRPTRPGAGRPGLSQCVSHRAGHGAVERAALAPAPDVSGARRPCNRVAPAVVDGVARAAPAGVRGPSALGGRACWRGGLPGPRSAPLPTPPLSVCWKALRG